MVAVKRLRHALLFVLAMPFACSTGSGAGSEGLPTATTLSNESTPAETPAASSAMSTSETKPSPTPAPHVFPLKVCAIASWDSTHHDYPAADVFAPEGTAFVAVTDGVVDWVNHIDRWDPIVDDPATRGGLSVAIVGDDGIRYYGSHLSSIARAVHHGLRVDAGEVLGYVGETGNARGPHLHFGISRPTFPADWETRRGEVWPSKYLHAWCNGRNVTPGLVPG